MSNKKQLRDPPLPGRYGDGRVRVQNGQERWDFPHARKLSL